MKKLLLALCLAVGLYSCSTPNYMLYHSTASVPQKSSFIKSEFQPVNKIEESLPFSVIIGTDKNKENAITEKYVLVSPPIGINNNMNSVVHNHSVVLKYDNIVEFLPMIDQALELYGNQKSYTSYEYQVAQENSIIKASENVETWMPEFKFNCKNLSGRCESFVSLGLVKSSAGVLNYTFFLDKDQLIELKARLTKAVEQLK